MRADTLPRIVDMILDRDNSMFKQLQMQKYTAASKFSMNAHDFYISTDEDEEAAAAWEPHPLESSTRISSNIISVRNRRND